MNFIFKSNGVYIGFISTGSLFSRDGEYWGWVENNYVWDSRGNFRGQIWNSKYIIFNQFAVSPVPRLPKLPPSTPVLPQPPINLSPVTLPTGWSDSF